MVIQILLFRWNNLLTLVKSLSKRALKNGQRIERYFWNLLDIENRTQQLNETCKDKKSLSILVKNQGILQKREMKHLILNKNLWKLKILMPEKQNEK